MAGDLILLVFLALLFAVGLNWVRKKLRLGPAGYAGAMIVFIIAMLLIWGQTLRG